MEWVDEIRKRLEAATPGPWRACGEHGKSQDFTVETNTGISWAIGDAIYHADNNNFRFIANAPTDIANLLKEREVLREALKKYADPDRVLGGSDYQMYATSSSRQAYDDDGRAAREALAWKPTTSEGPEEK